MSKVKKFLEFESWTDFTFSDLTAGNKVKNTGRGNLLMGDDNSDKDDGDDDCNDGDNNYNNGDDDVKNYTWGLC